MILPDFSVPHSKFHRAQPADRLNALVLDLLILSPFFQFAVSVLWKKIDFLNLTAPGSVELKLIWCLLVASLLFGSVAFQTLCWSLFGATPGQYFLKLRLVSDRSHQGRVPWTQSLVRSLVWHFCFFLMGIPFLEILSHPDRRLLPDRASETEVLSLKAEVDRGPHPLEIHFVRQIFLVLTILISVWVFFSLGQLYHWALKSEFKKDSAIEDQYLCADISEDSKNRVDEALALFLTKSVDEECLQKESEFALWTLDPVQRSWGSLGKGFLELIDLEKSNQYLKNSCEESFESESCQIARALLGGETLKLKAGSSLTSQVLEFESLEKSGRYKDLRERIRSAEPNVMTPSYSGYLLRAHWANGNWEEARGFFEALSLTQNSEQHQDSTAWLCDQEMKQSCAESAKSQACRDLKAMPASNLVDIAWAQLKLKSCRGSEEPRLSEFAEVFERRPDFRRLVEVTDSKSSREQRRYKLREIARLSGWSVRKLALDEWLEIADSPSDLREIKKYLVEHHQRAWAWEQLAVKLVLRAKKSSEQVLAREILTELKPERFQMAESLEDSKSASRLPASEKK